MPHDADLSIAPGVTLPDTAIRLRFARSSGPGGQNVNKLSTRVIMSVSLAALTEALGVGVVARLRRLAGRMINVDDLVITSQTSRSQIANRRDCMTKLRELVVQARVVPRVRKKTRPPRGAIERRLANKRHQSQLKGERTRRFGTAGDH